MGFVFPEVGEEGNGEKDVGSPFCCQDPPFLVAGDFVAPLGYGYKVFKPRGIYFKRFSIA
jgi:hypothetical protein